MNHTDVPADSERDAIQILPRRGSSRHERYADGTPRLRAGGVLGLVVPRLAGSRVSGRSADEGLVRRLHRPVRHGRVEHHVLPAAATVHGRGLAGASAGGIRLRGQGRPVRFAPDEVARSRAVAGKPPRSSHPARRDTRSQPRTAPTELATRHHDVFAYDILEIHLVQRVPENDDRHWSKSGSPAEWGLHPPANVSR